LAEHQGTLLAAARLAVDVVEDRGRRDFTDLGVNGNSAS
jgi:hypothetical protein